MNTMFLRQESAARPIIRTALLCAAAVASVAAQEISPMPAPVSAREPNFGIYAAEAGGATVGGIAGLGVGWVIGFAAYMANGNEEHALNTFVLASVPFVALGSASGTTLVGGAFRQQGRFLPTLAWSAGGTVIGLGLLVGGIQIADAGQDPLGVGVMSLGIAAPIVVTALGYNLSRPKETVGGRLLPGSVALGSVLDADGLAHPSLDVRLVNVRF